MDSNVMIGNIAGLAGKERLRDLRHMAANAFVSRIHRANDRARALGRAPRGVTGEARRDVGSRVRAGVLMGIVAGHAGEPVLALLEALALGEAVSLEEVGMLSLEI